MGVFFIEDDDLLEKYNIIWDKVSVIIKKELYGKPVYNRNFSKTKIKPQGNKVTNFSDEKLC